MTQNQSPPLSFQRSDIEKKLFMPAGEFTQPGPVLPAALAILSGVVFYLLLQLVPGAWLERSFTQRGWVPYAIVFFSAWAFWIIVVKYFKINVQARALGRPLCPDDPSFYISADTAVKVLDRLYDICDEPRDFLLYNRIQFALSNLKNLGRVGDVDEVLRSRADSDESGAESGYTVVKGLLWAIPVLGFIGTVLGLSVAIGSFGAVLATSADAEEIKPALQSVTAGLATAFETTLQALVVTLVIHMFMTMVRRKEERMFNRFNDYCERQVVAKIRIKHDGVQA